MISEPEPLNSWQTGTALVATTEMVYQPSKRVKQLNISVSCFEIFCQTLLFVKSQYVFFFCVGSYMCYIPVAMH